MAEHAVPFAKASISLSLLVSGVFLGSSAISVPALLAAESTSGAARQWAVLYNKGLLIAPTLAVAAFTSAAASSYYFTKQTPQLSFVNNKPATNILLSGVVTLLSMPWTILAMKGTNDSLLAYADKGVAAGKDRIVLQLIEYWGTTNTIRGLFPLIGAAIGVYFL